MPRFLRVRRERDERGAVAIMVAAALTSLLVIVAMVLDFGLVRIDRQVDRSAADAAVLAGLHGLDTGDGTPHPYVGVCTAAKYLKVNSDRFSTLNENAGWSNGLGGATADGCTDLGLRNKTCKPTDRSSWAKWSWSGTSGGVSLVVTIESGYDLAANQWVEDSLPATSGDNGDAAFQGCDHLAVTISQSREPGLGSLATSSDLRTAIRSVGRIKPSPGDSAPAMLLLKRTGCPVLKTGSSGGSSFIRVLGAISASGNSQPGTIHSDSDGVGCTGANDGWVYGGLGANGIVAYAAPLVSPPPFSPDPTKPGSITSVAAANGITGIRLRDSVSNVYSSSALNGTGGAHSEVVGRSLTTRRLVDERFFTGVRNAVAGASTVFATNSSGPPATGWRKFPPAVDACKPTAVDVAALTLTVADSLYIDCNGKFVGNAAGLVIEAGTVYFRGSVEPTGNFRLPNAHHVYIQEASPSGEAIGLSGSAAFQMNTRATSIPSNVDAVTGNCTSGVSTSKAVLFVRNGVIKQTGGTLRMCRTTAFLMGGQTATTATAGPGCVPLTTGTAPTTTPCNGALGTGQLSQNGGAVDWSAPNALDATVDPTTGDPLPAALTGWADVNGPEDLALWSESATNSSNTFSMGGGSDFRVRGVFMVPNANPFVISGGGTMNLTNAQYIVSSIELNGSGTNITMSVDADSAVTLPDQALVGLVR